MQNNILEILKKEKPYLEKEFGVEEIALFGSYARGNATKESDVDVLVKVHEVKYKTLVRILIYLEEKLNRRIDLVTKGPHLSERFYSIINKDIIYA